MKQDLTKLPVEALSEMVFGSRDLYRMRKDKDFIGYLKTVYKFTYAQETLLAHDLKSEAAA